MLKLLVLSYHHELAHNEGDIVLQQVTSISETASKLSLSIIS